MVLLWVNSGTGIWKGAASRKPKADNRKCRGGEGWQRQRAAKAKLDFQVKRARPEECMQTQVCFMRGTAREQRQGEPAERGVPLRRPFSGHRSSRLNTLQRSTGPGCCWKGVRPSHTQSCDTDECWVREAQERLIRLQLHSPQPTRREPCPRKWIYPTVFVP